MILGNHFFISPSDSLAMVAANCTCIPYFRNGLTVMITMISDTQACARSMPTSSAIDVVAEKRGIRGYEVPTGWKFFGNLMDSGLRGKQDTHPFLCGEESFGLGSDHIREKDGIFAILCWLSIVAGSPLFFHCHRIERNSDPSQPLVSLKTIATDYWKEFGRHYYTRYDYEGLETEQADRLMSGLKAKIAEFNRHPECASLFTVS